MTSITTLISRKTLSRRYVISAMLQHYYPGIPLLDRERMLDIFTEKTLITVKCTFIEWLHAEIVSYIRHTYTDYDLLLRNQDHSVFAKFEARDKVKPIILSILDVYRSL